MRTINEHGMLFSFDMLLAFFVICTMLYFMLLSISSIVQANVQSVKEFSFYQNAFSFADTAVKNSYSENAPGLAFYDAEKHRVLDNVLEYALLQEIDAEKMQNEKFFVKEIALNYASGAIEIINSISGLMRDDCSAVERFVLIKKGAASEKAKISFLLCGLEK